MMTDGISLHRQIKITTQGLVPDRASTVSRAWGAAHLGSEICRSLTQSSVYPDPIALISLYLLFKITTAGIGTKNVCNRYSGTRTCKMSRKQIYSSPSYKTTNPYNVNNRPGIHHNSSTESDSSRPPRKVAQPQLNGPSRKQNVACDACRTKKVRCQRTVLSEIVRIARADPALITVCTMCCEGRRVYEQLRGASSTQGKITEI